MRQERTVQASIFDLFAGHEIGRELKAMSQWLDEHPALISSVAEDLRRRGVKETGAVFASSAPGDPNHLYVLTKDDGEIHILNPANGTSQLFLTIPGNQFSNGGERGVIGLGELVA